MRSGARKSSRGMLLIETFVYILLVFAIIGIMSSTVFFTAQSLRKRAERELKDERWLALVQHLRDDLRSAQQINWKPTSPASQPEELLFIRRSDGNKVEIIQERQQVLRRVVDKSGKMIETPFPFQTTAWKLWTPRDGAEDAWDFQPTAPNTLFKPGPSPLFFYVTVTVHGRDQRLITEQFGVATRFEGAREVKP